MISVKDQEHFQDRQFFRTRFTAGKSETDRGVHMCDVRIEKGTLKDVLREAAYI